MTLMGHPLTNAPGRLTPHARGPRAVRTRAARTSPLRAARGRAQGSAPGHVRTACASLPGCATHYAPA